MNRIKNLDYFRKSEHNQATRIGGVISIACIISISWLTMFEWSEYLKPTISKDTGILIDMEHDKFVKFNLDIIFPKAPCSVFDMQLTTGYTSDVNE